MGHPSGGCGRAGLPATGDHRPSVDELRKWAPAGAVYDTLRELFSRVVFNVCVGNIDDHARNHAMFWDGEHLELTPAYDLSPQPR